MVSKHLQPPIRNTNNKKIRFLLNILEEGETIRYEPHRNIVLFLGNTGSGKSTFTQFMAGDNNNLVSQEIVEGTGEFIIVDNNNKISGNSTITSHTIFPEMVKDFKTNTVFYDCPGFSDTRSLAHDVSVTYFIKKIIDSAKAVKLVFVVSYPSVRHGVDRQDFMLLVKHATTMIKDITKFKDSIALIITKVDNQLVKQKRGGYILVSDDKIVSKIGEFLKLVKAELTAKSELENAFYKNAIEFVNVLLTKDGGKYNKIGIFRRPDMAGMVSQLPLLQEEKSKLSEIVFDNIQFIAHSERDFGYTISAESKNYIHDLTNEIIKAINLNVANIGKKIQNHFLALENKFSDIHHLNSQFELGNSLLSKMENRRTFLNIRDIINSLTNVTNSLNIMSGKNLFEISNYDKYLRFIQTVNGDSTVNPLTWAQGLTNTVDYITDSRKWYHFLIRFFNRLSEYDIQVDIKKFPTSHLKYTITYAKLATNKKIKFDDIDLQQFLNQLDPNHYHLDYSDLTGISLNGPKLDVLKKLVDETLNHKVEIFYPTSNKIIVKGKYLKLSDIIAKISAPNMEFVEIFALYKVFIDTSIDKTGHKAKFSIIAPTWQIIGNQSIILDGTPGASHTSNAPSGTYPGNDGTNGEAGKPGGPAGHFVGIGETFINGEFLTISTNGGRGSAGQNGGNGLNGKIGNDPPFPDNGERDVWRRGGFPFTIDYERYGSHHKFLIFGNVREHRSEYTVYGTNGTNGGNGGDGGIGGDGGHHGTIKLIEFNKKSNIYTTSLPGETGQPGIGGFPGDKGVNGRKMTAAIYREWEYSEKFPTYMSHYNLKYTSYGTILYSGSKGKTGSSYINRKYLETTTLPNMSPTINSYTNYLRESLTPSANELFLKHIHDSLNNNVEITEFYDTDGLINEFYDLENTYIQTKAFSLLPSYESLLRRIDKYSNAPDRSEQSGEYKKTLSYLYTAVLSKMFYINHNVNSNLKFNLYQELEMVLKDINRIKEVDHIRVGIEYYMNQQKEINSRTIETRQFIDTHIITEIHNISYKIDEQTDLLLTDLISDDEVVTEEIVTIIEDEIEGSEEDIEDDILNTKSLSQKRQLKQTILLRATLSSVKIAQEFVSFLITLAPALNVAQNAVVLKSLLLDDPNQEKVDEINAMFSSVLDFSKNIENRHQNNLDLFLKQLVDVEQQMSQFLQNSSSENLEESRKQILKILEVGEISDESMYSTRKACRYAIILNKKLLDEQETQSESVGKELKLLNLIQNIISIEGISTTFYERIRTNYSKINKLAESIQEMADELNEINIFNDNLYKEADIENIKKNITNLIKNLLTAPSISINIREWNLQEKLKTVFHKLQSLTDKFNIDEELREYVERLEQSITFVCNIYDNIENINNLGKLAAYISNVDSAKSTQIEVKNDKLIQVINELEKIIKSNLIAGQYYKALGTFQKHVFPFAASYFNDLVLPNYTELKLNPNSVDEFTDQVIKKIKDLQSTNLQSTTTLNQYDTFIHNKVEFNSKYVQMSPFLVWPHENIKESVSRLLEGKEVTLRADISKGLDKNVIKFNQIGIRFEINNSALQEEFDQLLNNFGITMKHQGDSHYKCGNNIYTMISDKKTIYYSFKTKDDGEPIDTNEVYDKIKKNSFILSPYATWSIKITNISNSFDVLKEFRNENMSIELQGYGQYIDKEIDICSNKLDPYYKIDESLSKLENEFYTAENLRNKLEEVSLNNSDITRTRREIEHLATEEEPLHATSGATSTTRFSILNNLLYSLGNGFVALNYLNPVNVINEWFTKNDNTINAQRIEASYNLPHGKFANEPIAKLQIQNSNIRNQFEYDLPDLQSNLLLLDLWVKMKTKNKNSRFSVSSITDNEFAQKLAYNAYVPKE